MNALLLPLVVVEARNRDALFGVSHVPFAIWISFALDPIDSLRMLLWTGRRRSSARTRQLERAEAATSLQRLGTSNQEHSNKYPLDTLPNTIICNGLQFYYLPKPRKMTSQLPTTLPASTNSATTQSTTTQRATPQLTPFQSAIIGTNTTTAGLIQLAAQPLRKYDIRNTPLNPEPHILSQDISHDGVVLYNLQVEHSWKPTPYTSTLRSGSATGPIIATGKLRN